MARGVYGWTCTFYGAPCIRAGWSVNGGEAAVSAVDRWSLLITLRSVTDVNQVRTVVDVARRPLGLWGVAAQRAAGVPVVGLGLRCSRRPIDHSLSPGPRVRRRRPAEERLRAWTTTAVCQVRPLYWTINRVSEVLVKIVGGIVVVVVIGPSPKSGHHVVSDDVIKQVPGWRPLAAQLHHVDSPAKQHRLQRLTDLFYIIRVHYWWKRKSSVLGSYI